MHVTSLILCLVVFSNLSRLVLLHKVKILNTCLSTNCVVIQLLNPILNPKTDEEDQTCKNTRVIFTHEANYSAELFLLPTSSNEGYSKRLKWSLHHFARIKYLIFYLSLPSSLYQALSLVHQSGYGISGTTSLPIPIFLIQSHYTTTTNNHSITTELDGTVEDYFMITSLVLLIDKPSWFILCHLCSKTSLVFYTLKSNATVETVVAKHLAINSQAHGNHLVVQSNEFYAPDLVNPKCHVENYKLDHACYQDGVILGIMMIKLNVSGVTLIEASQDSFSRNPNVCVACFFDSDESIFEEYTSKQGVVVQLTTETLKLAYCIQQGSYVEPSVTVFTKPFDLWIWVTTLVISVLIGLTRRSFVYFLDIIWVILLQPPQIKWTRSSILSWFLGTLMILSYGYQGVITRDVIAPPDPKVMEANELLNTGYRMLSPSKEFSESVLARFKHILEKWNVTPSRQQLFIEDSNYKYVATPNIFQIMAEKKGIVHTLEWIDKKFKKQHAKGSQTLTQDEFNLLVTPSVLEVYQVMWTFRFFLADKLRIIFEQLRTGGFYDYWSHAFFLAVYYTKGTQLQGKQPVIELKLTSAIRYVFMLYAIGMAISCVKFLVEISLQDLVKVKESLKRRSYIRSIKINFRSFFSCVGFHILITTTTPISR